MIPTQGTTRDLHKYEIADEEFQPVKGTLELAFFNDNGVALRHTDRPDDEPFRADRSDLRELMPHL
ncbi:hypothetical protein [Nonomuraea sp. NPDC049400]|uniref:hypothetical protein n=1 Tax=Nonomuraea sp. NPDC049400 TaxID=3364352 RepID=UPI00378D6BD0